MLSAVRTRGSGARRRRSKMIGRSGGLSTLLLCPSFLCLTLSGVLSGFLGHSTNMAQEGCSKVGEFIPVHLESPTAWLSDRQFEVPERENLTRKGMAILGDREKPRGWGAPQKAVLHFWYYSHRIDGETQTQPTSPRSHNHNSAFPLNEDHCEETFSFG